MLNLHLSLNCVVLLMIQSHNRKIPLTVVSILVGTLVVSSYVGIHDQKLLWAIYISRMVK